MCSWKRSCPFQSRRKEEGRVLLETSFPLKLVLIVLVIFPLLSKSCFEEIKPLQEQKRFWFSLKEIHPYYDSDTYDGNQKRACQYRGYNKQHKVKSEQKKKAISWVVTMLKLHFILHCAIALNENILCFASSSLVHVFSASQCNTSLCILPCPACREQSAHLLAPIRAQDRSYSGNCIGTWSVS